MYEEGRDPREGVEVYVGRTASGAQAQKRADIARFERVGVVRRVTSKDVFMEEQTMPWHAGGLYVREDKGDGVFEFSRFDALSGAP